MNSRIIENEYDYIAPSTLDEALSIIDSDKQVRVIAGGTDMLVKLKMGVYEPFDILMDISKISELTGKTHCACGGTHIGACMRLRDVELDEELYALHPVLREAIKKMASVSVRNMATLGGNIVNASPVADTVPPLIALGARLVIRSLGETRKLDIEDFFISPGVNALKKNELLCDVGIRPEPKNFGAAFLKLSRVASDIAKISLAVGLTRDGDKIASCRIAMGSVANKPLYLKEISESLSNERYSDALLKDIGLRISDFIKPIDDTRSNKEYRHDMAQAMAREAFARAYERSAGSL